jgi:hypothetical protein
MKTGVPRAGGTLRIRTFYVCGFEGPKHQKVGTLVAGSEAEADDVSNSAGEPVKEQDLTEDQKRANVIRLVFSGDEARFNEFCQVVRDAIPLGVGAVLRGSAVTGIRWKDGAPFDADGQGTSDMDLTLVGGDALDMFRLDGFFVPGVHSRPLSDDEDPGIAPDLAPLRQKLINMVGRPVNIQATGDLVMFLRGDLLGQPYLTLVARPDK